MFKHTKTRQWWIALGFLVATTLLIKFYQNYVPYSVRYITTPSIPTGLYGAVKYDRSALSSGESVCFKPSPKAWMVPRHYFKERESICKYVLGVPGDEVRVTGTKVSICHANKCSFVGEVLPTDSQGRPSIAAFDADSVIPEGYYYLGANQHPRSFDSRYLGLIPAADITVKITPIWTES